MRRLITIEGTKVLLHTPPDNVADYDTWVTETAEVITGCQIYDGSWPTGNHFLWDNTTSTVVADDVETIDMLRNLRYNETYPEYISRFSQHIKRHRGIDWEHSQYNRILNLKIDGTATNAQLQVLAKVDHLRGLLEDLQDYIEDPVRTVQELENLDTSSNTWWYNP